MVLPKKAGHIVFQVENGRALSAAKTDLEDNEKTLEATSNAHRHTSHGKPDAHGNVARTDFFKVVGLS